MLLALVVVLATRTVFSFTDPAIDESSGLVDRGSTMVTTNDSGDDAVVYLIDPRTGATIGRTEYADSVLDVEALAPAGPAAVWAADIGDNRRVRPAVRVFRVPVGTGERDVDAPAYDLVYPDGAHDAESLFVAGGRLHVVTKGILGGTVYVAPRHLDGSGANRLRPVGRVSVFATDAALFPDGRHVLVRGYGSAEVRTVPGFRKVAEFELPDQEQGEGVSIGPGGRIRLSSEGANSAVLQVALPADVRTAMRPAEPTPSPTADAASAAQVDTETEARTSFPTAALVAAAALLGLLAAGWTWRRRRAGQHSNRP